MVTAPPVLLVTVGAFAPIVEAPEKVRVWSPVYDVATLPNGSRAVIVRLSAAPGVGEVVAADRPKDEMPAAATATVRRAAPAAAIAGGAPARRGGLRQARGARGCDRRGAARAAVVRGGGDVRRLGLVEHRRAAGGGDAVRERQCLVAAHRHRAGGLVRDRRDVGADRRCAREGDRVVAGIAGRCVAGDVL